MSRRRQGDALRTRDGRHLREQPLAGPVTITRADGTVEVRPPLQPTVTSHRLDSVSRAELRDDVHDATCPVCGGPFPPTERCCT